MRRFQSSEEKREYKARKRAVRKRIVSEYGYTYYLRDKTWFNIKDQRSGEDFAAWKKRLAFYGFSTDGVDLKSGKRHNAPPTVTDWGEAADAENLS